MIKGKYNRQIDINRHWRKRRSIITSRRSLQKVQICKVKWPKVWILIKKRPCKIISLFFLLISRARGGGEIWKLPRHFKLYFTKVQNDTPYDKIGQPVWDLEVLPSILFPPHLILLFYLYCTKHFLCPTACNCVYWLLLMYVPKFIFHFKQMDNLERGHEENNIFLPTIWKQ